MHKILQILLLIAGLFSAGCAADQKMEFYPLDKPAIADLGHKREAASKMATVVGEVFSGNDKDIVIIQKILGAKEIGKIDNEGYLALGVIFGDLLVSKYQLDWVITVDSWGRDIVLKPTDQAVSISAHTMILKRIEKGENVNVLQLYEDLCGALKKDFSIKMRAKE